MPFHLNISDHNTGTNYGTTIIDVFILRFKYFKQPILKKVLSITLKTFLIKLQHKKGVLGLMHVQHQHITLINEVLVHH